MCFCNVSACNGLPSHEARSVFRIDFGKFLFPIDIVLIESVNSSTAEIVTS